MNVLIIASVFVIIVALIAFVFHRMTRPLTEENPKRRELKTAKLRAVNAQRAIDDVNRIFVRYQTFIGEDAVAQAMVSEINARIDQYRNETLELDK